MQPAAADDLREIVVTVARAVALVALHCGVPVHIACVRRLAPATFSARVARACLALACDMLLAQFDACEGAGRAASGGNATADLRVYVVRCSAARSAQATGVSPSACGSVDVGHSIDALPRDHHRRDATSSESGAPSQTLLPSSSAESDVALRDELVPAVRLVAPASCAALVAIWIAGSDFEAVAAADANARVRGVADAVSACAWRLDLRTLLVTLGLGDVVRSVDAYRAGARADAFLGVFPVNDAAFKPHLVVTQPRVAPARRSRPESAVFSASDVTYVPRVPSREGA
jgi:hypothetical protein